MSEEQLKAFIAKLQADSSLQEQLKAEGADPVAIAKAAGFAITTEDLNYHRQNLTDAELECLAGGLPPSWETCGVADCHSYAPGGPSTPACCASKSTGPCCPTIPSPNC